MGQEILTHRPSPMTFLSKKGEENLSQAEVWPVNSYVGPSETDFRLKASRAERKYFCCFKPPSLQEFVIVPQETNTSPAPSFWLFFE